LPFVFGAPPALSPTAPGGLFGVFDSSKMVIKFTGGSENETVKKEEQEEKEEESKEGDDLGEGTSDKKPHKGAQTAVYELPVPELEKQIKVCRVRVRVRVLSYVSSAYSGMVEQTLELSLASVNATKADLTERLASVGAQITDLTDRKTLLQALYPFTTPHTTHLRVTTLTAHTPLLTGSRSGRTTSGWKRRRTGRSSGGPRWRTRSRRRAASSRR
jgi:hypothetical protein